MDIKGLLGDAYKEGMSVDEINAALADKEFVDSSTLPKSISKDLFDKKVSELAKIKKDYEKLKESSMTAEEKQQKAIEDAENARRDYAIKSTKLDVEKIFVESGLTHDDYDSIMDSIVSEDSEKSTALAKSFAAVIERQKAEAVKSVKTEILKKAPNPPAGSGNTDMTLTEFRKLSPQERYQFSIKNPDGYKKLYGGKS